MRVGSHKSCSLFGKGKGAPGGRASSEASVSVDPVLEAQAVEVIPQILHACTSGHFPLANVGEKQRVRENTPLG